MRMYLHSMVPVLLALLASCGSDSDSSKNPALAPKETVPSPEVKSPEAESEAVRRQAPAVVVARVKKSDLNLKSSPIELVSVASHEKITSGSEAAKAFASGSKLQLRQTNAGLVASNNEHTMLMNIPGFNPVQYQGQNQGQIPFGGYYPSAAGVGGGPLSILNGVVSFVGGFLGGIINTIGSLLAILNPIKWIGNTGIGFQPSGSFPFGDYQYYPYNQGPIYNPGSYPNQQFPYPQSGPQYPYP